jgi:hypothetical protein
VRWAFACFAFSELFLPSFLLKWFFSVTDDYGWQSFSSLIEQSSSKGAATDLSEQAARERAKQRCFCGAPFCRGWLGGKKIRENDNKKKKKDTTGDAQKKPKKLPPSFKTTTLKPANVQKNLRACRAGTASARNVPPRFVAGMKRKR